MNPEKKSNGGQDLSVSRVDLQKLKIAQDQKDQEIGKKSQLQQKEDEAQKALQTKAVADIERRGPILAELKSLQTEVDLFKSQQIEEKIKNAQKLKESKKSKEEELSKTESELTQINNDLQEIKELIGDKKETELADEIIEALSKIELTKNEIEKRLGELIEEIKNIEAELVSEDQIKTYQEILKRIEELNTEIDRIESNPYVIEQLIEEANSENELRDTIIDAVLSKISYGNKEKREIFSQLTQIFLTEEFDFNGFNQIKDKSEREEAMKNLIQEILVFLKTPNLELPKKFKTNLNSVSSYGRAGIVLKILTAGYGSVANLGRFSSLGIETRGDKNEKIKSNEYIQSHLGALNYLRAISFVVKSIQGDLDQNVIDKFLSSYVFQAQDWKNLDQQLYSREFIVFPDGPIFPAEATDSDRKKIQEKFDVDFNNFQKLIQEFIAKENNKIETEIKNIEAEIDGLKKEIDQLTLLLTQAKEQLNEYRKSENEFLGIEREIKELKDQLNKVGKNLSDQGFFAFGNKSRLRQQMGAIEQKIRLKNREKKELEKKTKDILNFFKDNSLEYMIDDPIKMEIEVKLTEAEKKLHPLERRLAHLESRLIRS